MLPTALSVGQCTTISGNLRIQCSSDAVTPPDQRIYNLTFLSKVHTINGYLKIADCDHLESLAGLESLTTILGAPASAGTPSLEIRACKQLKDVKALEGLGEITQGEPSVRIIEGNDALCYHDRMPWSNIVANSEDLSAGGLALDKVRVNIFVQSAECLDNEFECDPSCFCGYCGGPGVCLDQAHCEEKWTDTPDWVLQSHADKAAYAFIIIFAILGSVLTFATLIGCILGKVKTQVLITFQKPPKKIRPALRPTPFGGAQNPGIAQWQPGMQQQDLPAADAPQAPGADGGHGQDGAAPLPRDVTRLRPMSQGANSVVSLPRLNTDQEALTRDHSAASRVEDGAYSNGDGQAATENVEPDTKLSMAEAMAIEKARNRFVTPGQVEKIGGDDTEGSAEPEADMICPTDDCGKVAEFVCSRCSKQGYCSSSCQRTHWKTHRADCKRWTKEARAKRVSQARRRSSLGQAQATSVKATPTSSAGAETPAETAAPAQAADPAKAPEPPKATEAAAETVAPVPAAEAEVPAPTTAVFDLDQDGKITADEFNAALDSNEAAPAGEAAPAAPAAEPPAEEAAPASAPAGEATAAPAAEPEQDASAKIHRWNSSTGAAAPAAEAEGEATAVPAAEEAPAAEEVPAAPVAEADEPEAAADPAPVTE